MARSIETIYTSIIAEKEANADLAGLTSTSVTAIWRLWAYITAVCMAVHEGLFDAHKAEVAALILAERVHTQRWYVSKAKAFQYGDSLIAERDVYAVIDPDAMIVKEAAVEEVTSAGVRILRVKVAKASGAVLTSLDAGELDALTAYMERVKDAGVHLDITTQAGDDLQLVTNVYYDPLVLDAAGARLDGTSATPVIDAVNAFIVGLPFNGLFVINDLIAHVRKVEGVVNFAVRTAEYQIGSGGYTSITDEVAPDAGYFALDEGHFTSNVSYIAG